MNYRPLQLVILLTLTVTSVVAQDVDWPHYAADRFSSKYLPLDQINVENVDSLKEVWRWKTEDDAIVKENPRFRPGQFKVTPLVVKGVMYASTGLSQVAAIDPATGKTLWVYNPKSYENPRPANTGYQHRGLEYWTDGTVDRILIATGGRQLISIDPETQKPDPNFGTNGIVDLSKGLGGDFSLTSFGFNAPTIVIRDTIVVGSIISDGPTRKEMTPGHVRGFDIRTGKQKWIFRTIPQEGEFGNDTWLEDSWKYTGNTNVWTWMSGDEELGYVYLPVSTPTNDWYGGHRKGNNLFAESLVCLNADTGKRVWHFQGVHHGLWDYDFPAAPNLVDLTVNGKQVKAVAQVSKQGFTYVFNRVTGKPIWPINELPVPQTTVPGEWTSPTQPHPTKPPAFERQGFSVDDLNDLTPELHAEALEIIQNYEIGPLFTPPPVLGENGKQGVIMLPSAAGGANWGGAAVDPDAGVMIVASMTLPMLNAVAKGDPNRTNFDYQRTGGFIAPGPQGLSLTKPPYGRITAYDLNKGEIIWQVPHGDGQRDHPALKGLALNSLGAAANGVLSNGGGVLTKELFFMIQADEDTTSMMRMKTTGYIRAYDKRNGFLIWEQEVDKTPHGSAMTYMHKGKQYIVHAVGGFNQPAELIAYALPN